MREYLVKLDVPALKELYLERGQVKDTPRNIAVLEHIQEYHHLLLFIIPRMFYHLLSVECVAVLNQ